MASRSKQESSGSFDEISAKASDEACLFFCYELCFVVALVVTMTWDCYNKGAFRGTLEQLKGLFAQIRNNWKKILLATLQIIPLLVLVFIATGY